MARDAVSPGLLLVAMPNCLEPVEWADQLSDALAWGRIRKPQEVALFLAHVGHESRDLTSLEESLWYSAGRLCEVWPRRYPSIEAARPYAENPEALANHTYGGRLGNTMKGDGWRFRGRGSIQLTGRYNYAECAKGTGLPLITHPDRLASIPRYAAMSAVWYWTTRVTPGGDIRSTTKEINGGLHGLVDRDHRFTRILQHLGGA
ncbi:glycoside hydrolase [Halomonas sp. ND22Bw]|nr:glycoside hydrolase [Halomonas sp. ND22Bw]